MAISSTRWAAASRARIAIDFSQAWCGAGDPDGPGPPAARRLERLRDFERRTDRNNDPHRRVHALENVDPEVYRLLDMHAVRDAARAGLLLKLEPQFVSTTMHAELPTMTNLSGQWDGYVEGQDLTGLERDRVRQLGHDYIGSAIEAAGEPA